VVVATFKLDLVKGPWIFLGPLLAALPRCVTIRSLGDRNMIREDRYLNALHCFFQILQQARQLAIEHREYQIEKLLTAAETMPYLIGSKADHTEEFRTSVAKIAGQSPDWSYILDIFDGHSPDW
jgi:hypothetical protein